MADRAKRDYKTGGLRERGANSWELKVRTLDPRTGKRVARYFTFKGSKQAAKQRLRDLTIAADNGSLPDDKKPVAAILDAWGAALDVSPKTAERYRELVDLHIRPHLGSLKARSVTPSRLEQFYGDLRAGRSADGSNRSALSARTVSHVHRLVVQIFGMAERDKVIESSPARHAKRPKVERQEVEILSEAQVRDVLGKLKGRTIYPIVALALASGMRRGELLALRWKDVNFDEASIHVQQSLEQTKGEEPLRFKSPKTRSGRRIISLPPSIITELRGLKRRQAEERMALGLGRAPDDDLVFHRPDGSPHLPNSLTTEWRRLVQSLKLPKVSFHALRHTHASQLIASNMDVLTISRRLGHGSPSITLDVYSHFFRPTDNAAAAIFETAFGAVLGE